MTRTAAARSTAPVSPASIWVVAADAGRARIFRSAGVSGRLKEFEDLLNPDDRVTARQLVSDREGRVSNSAAGTGHALAPREELFEHVAATFARRLARRLAQARTAGALERLYLVADPRFLGLLRGTLDRPTRRLVAAELTADLTRHRASSIRRRLPERL